MEEACPACEELLQTFLKGEKESETAICFLCGSLNIQETVLVGETKNEPHRSH